MAVGFREKPKSAEGILLVKVTIHILDYSLKVVKTFL
jgi:hypothetical protein